MEPVMYKTADEIIVELREKYGNLHDAAKAFLETRDDCGACPLEVECGDGVECLTLNKLRDILAAMSDKPKAGGGDV